MKEITARVVFEYDFTEMIQEQNEERAVGGEPDMNEDEIRAFIEEDLYSFDYNDAVGGVDIDIKISQNDPSICENQLTRVYNDIEVELKES